VCTSIALVARSAGIPVAEALEMCWPDFARLVMSRRRARMS
jgi:hypothetical protein